MITPQFETAIKRLNKAQKEAVETIEGPVMVIAGPGTGKTQILTVRIANILLKTQVNPENILALTFTESGVLAMRNRLVEMIGTSGFRVDINTFHGFCNLIIQMNPEDFEDLLNFESITEIEQIQILEKILTYNSFDLIKPLSDPYYYVKPLLSAINDLKKEGVSSEDLKSALGKQKQEFENIDDLYHEKGAYKGQIKGKYLDLQRDIAKNEQLCTVYAFYQQELKLQKKYDFNDMILKTIEILQKNQNLLLRVQETYQYILVDEHQDTNTAQNKLIELICSFYEIPNLFVVGDEKQAIYRFQGASLENFLYFKSIYPSAKLINLEDNYRSSQIILDAATSLIKNNITSEIINKQIDLKSKTSYKEEPVKVAAFSDYYAEYYFISFDILDKIKNGEDPREIAVLVRNNRDLTTISNSFDQFGVPYNIEADQNIFADPDVRKLVFLFRAICNFGDDLHLIKLMHADFLNIDSLDLYRLMDISRKEKLSVYQIISDEERLKKLNLKNYSTISKLYFNLSTWKVLCDNDNLQSVFTTFLSNSGLLKSILKKPNYLDILDKITALFEEAKLQAQKDPKLSLADFLSYLDLLENHDLLIKKNSKTTLKEAVRIMTAHKSKGLEFNEVYIPQSFDGHWGNLRSKSRGFKIPWNFLGIKIKLDFEIEENEDERRLYFVTITRAKREVLISYSKSALDGKEQVPSQFLLEIDDKFKQELDVSNFEKKFLEEKQVIFTPAKPQTFHRKENSFFKELFIERGLSATAVNNYLSCPWKYFYRNLLQLPDVKTKSLIFGTAIHSAINAYICAMEDDNASFEVMIDRFKLTLIKEVDDNSRDFHDLLIKGEKVLKSFFENEAQNWTGNLHSEIRIKGIRLSDNIVLNGMIDMIEPKENNTVTVYDFKTGSPKSRGEIEGTTKTGSGDYKRQLVFYKILLDEYQMGKMNMTEGAIVFVEPDNKGKYHKEIFEISEDEVNILKNQILQISQEIEKLDFWERRCDDKDCEYCKLRDLMESEDHTEEGKTSIKITKPEAYKDNILKKDQIPLFEPEILPSDDNLETLKHIES